MPIPVTHPVASGADVAATLALADFRDLRSHLRWALIARDSMRQKDIAQVRRDLAVHAYSRAVDQIVDVLDRLDRQPISSGEGTSGTLAVLEQVLTAICEGEARLRRAL